VRIYTRRGDDGTTDEAVAALGMARVFIADSILADLVLRLQRELFVAGAELATATENSHKLTPGQTKVTAEMVDGLERAIDEYVGRTHMPEEFIVPGESRGSAFLDYARTVIRRAERQTVAMDRAGMLADGEVVRYLNRLADLVFVLARYEEGDFRTLRSG